MRVIVTRPEPSASLTAERLKASGHEPVVLPLFQACHLPENARAALTHKAGGLIITSAEAARVLATLADAIQHHFDKPVFAVGEATARAARDLGFRDVRVSGGNGEALAELIAKEENPSYQPLLYLAGEPRNPGLEHRLKANGMPFATSLVYRMVPIDYPGSELASLAGGNRALSVLLYSREAALRFTELFDRQPVPAPEIAHYFCLSQAIADALPPLSRQKALVAEQPREDLLLALLDQP